MSREKYVFNPNTLQYEKIHTSWKRSFLKIGGLISAILVCSLGLYLVAYTIIPTPKEMAMERELTQMEYQFSSFSSDFDKMAAKLNDLHDKDVEVHRVIFGIEPINNSIWEGGTGGSVDNNYLSNIKSSEEFIETTQNKLENLKYKLQLQENSLDTILFLAKQRERKLLSIPSIKPVREDKLKRNIRSMSGYGYRIHPVHKVKKFHKGIDFTAPRGTAIQATGNGKVKRVQNKRLGYGKNIIIDHGFGYTTLYAHLDEIDVKVGDIVTKGQKIGVIGSTGTSTAPHLHYEVRINGKQVNPIDYCMDGLTPEEYQELVHKASIENQSFDY
ncbi:MAG: M23 family metallopeptidase [Saprospiraceae bacterium]|nr:M23 family metallopeptidase [Saprospiraceae bacterium]